MNHWLVKTEPETFSWNDFLKERRTVWTGVRNFQARNNLRTMKENEPVLFYHSGNEKQIVGIAQVSKEAYPDPTAAEGDWSCVELVPIAPFPRPVTLATVKGDPLLKEIALVRNSRLSVSPLTVPQFARLLALAKEGKGAQ